MASTGTIMVNIVSVLGAQFSYKSTRGVPKTTRAYFTK